jgi:hypothetical protein
VQGRLLAVVAGVALVAAQDSCAGTLTRVVRAGKSYLAEPRG